MNADERRFQGIFSNNSCLTLIAYAFFAIGSFLHLLVLMWLIGPEDGPLWVGFLSPAGSGLYVMGMLIGWIAFRQSTGRYALMAMILNATLTACYLAVIAVYIVIFGLLG